MIWVGLIEKHAAKQSPTRIEELVKIFVHATKVSPHTPACMLLWRGFGEEAR